MARGFLCKHTTTDRRSRRKDVKFPPVLRKSLESDLKTNVADIAGKRKRGISKDLPLKRGRTENVPGIKQTFVSFDFEPKELNCHRFVSTRLQCILDSSDVNINLVIEKGLLLIHHSSVSVGDICLRLFESQPACEKPIEDGVFRRNTVVLCYVDENLEKNKELMAHLAKSVERSHLFFVSAQNGSTSIGSFLEKSKMKVSPNQIITRKAQMPWVYQTMYEDLERNVEDVRKIIDTLPQESEIQAIRRKLAYIEKKLKERKKPKRLSENCKRELESALDFGVIAYRTDSESLTVYINQPRTRSLDAKLRELEKICSPLVLRCCRVQTPIYRPHSLRAGCQVETEGADVLGTIGIFGKQVLEHAEKDIGITSAHVIWEGCCARVHMEDSDNDNEIGHCIWPPRPPDENLEGKVLDMAVIEMRSGMAENISTSENISVYTGQKHELELQKVYKSGWKTGETDGDIDIPQFNMFGKTVMVITSADGRNFCEPGDSGALVLTKKGTQLFALGLVFGDDLEFRENDEDFPANASIAIYLDDAITKFEEDSKRGKIKIQRY